MMKEIQIFSNDFPMGDKSERYHKINRLKTFKNLLFDEKNSMLLDINIKSTSKCQKIKQKMSIDLLENSIPQNDFEGKDLTLDEGGATNS